MLFSANGSDAIKGYLERHEKFCKYYNCLVEQVGPQWWPAFMLMKWFPMDPDEVAHFIVFIEKQGGKFRGNDILVDDSLEVN